MGMSEAFDTLKSEIQSDDDYAWTWHCNIAMAFQDEGGSRSLSNVAASRFMSTCFGVDTSSLPQAEDSADEMYPPHIQRVIDEKSELDFRKSKLEDFIADNPTFKTLDSGERKRMIDQQKAMNSYSDLLGQWINAVAAKLSERGTRGRPPSQKPESKDMDTITASAAREITQDNLKGPLKGPAIETFVSTLTNKIKMVAKEGKSSFDPWVYIGSLRGRSPSTEEREAIRKHFENAGFTWNDHPDPDPGHPASRPYTTLSW